MDKQLLILMEDINTALTKFISVAKSSGEERVPEPAVSPAAITPVEPTRLLPSTPTYTVEPEADTAVAPTEVATSQSVSVTPTITPEAAEPEEVGEFPFTASQVNTLRRKQLRELIVKYNLPITGPNGESPEELLVAPLRDAVRTYIRAQEMHAAIAAKEITSPATKSVVATEDIADAEPDPAPESEVKLELVEVSEPVVQEDPVMVEAESHLEANEPAPTSGSSLGSRGKQFLQWVIEQGGGASLDTVDPNAYAEKTAELANFFETNLPYVHGPDREPLDAYFNKMECQANCASCPNGNVQTLFCYGMFDEEVTSLNIKDAVEDGQYFKLGADTGTFESAPTV